MLVIFETVKKYAVSYVGFTRRDGARKLSTALAAAGMALLAAAFVRTEPVLTALYALIGAVAASSLVSRRIRAFVYDNRAVVFVAFLLITAAVFVYVVR